jgi:hypothetical protein
VASRAILSALCLSGVIFVLSVGVGAVFVGRGAGLRAGVHPVIRQVLRNRVSKNPTNSFFKIITPFPH